MPTTYFYLRPSAFSVFGFTYGKVEGIATRGGKVNVKLVQSGRWTEEDAQSVDMTDDELAPREVTQEEALDGAGTFVGSVICTARLKPGGARIWDYGLVVGNKWCAAQGQGKLDVNFSGAEMSVVYAPESTQDVAVEIYALQPCAGRSTSLLMAPEMKQQHVKVYNKFNGVDEPATRDSKTILADVGGKPVDESRTLPLLDITSFDVSQVTIHHILDYVYYKEGGRSQPAGMVFGESIFDEVISQDRGPSVASQRPLTTSTGTEVVLSDGHIDSEDDEPVLGTPRRASRVMEPPDAKRRRRTAMVNEDTPRVRDPQVPFIPAAENRRLEPDVDQLLALHRSGAVTDSSAQVLVKRSEDATSKSQFQPTGMQTTVHLALTNGKYASYTAQQFVEFVQVHWRKYGFFPHPAVLRGLFGWDFGTRGLSILHFVRVTELEKRERVRRSDMSNFSKKNKLPVPTEATKLSVLVGAVEVLCNISRQLYLPAVHETLEAATTFLTELCVSELPTSVDALAQITAWIDDRLELFRVFVADESLSQASSIKSHFSASHESFVRVHQVILRHDVASALKAAKSAPIRNDRGNGGAGSDKRVFIPIEIRKALPKQGLKQICLRFLSAQGCRGKNGNCIIKNLCHFKLAALPDSVRDFIASNYGGLSADME